ncbi:MAG: DUF4870 family protein [Halioglobus sp.]
MAQQPTSGLINLTYLIYGLHLFSALTGVMSSAFVVTAFLTGWPSIVAIILNYVKRSDTRGTFLESHFRWQIRTFWFTVLWMVVAFLIALTFVGIPLAYVFAVVIGLWVLYRMLRGIIRLMDDEPMPE